MLLSAPAGRLCGRGDEVEGEGREEGEEEGLVGRPSRSASPASRTELGSVVTSALTKSGSVLKKSSVGAESMGVSDRLRGGRECGC